MDVLYSLVDIPNLRLDNLAQENIFTRILNFVLTESADITYSIADSIHYSILYEYIVENSS